MLLRRILLVIATLLGLALIALFVYGWQASPRHQGQLQASGLRAAVSVERDGHGVPTLKASSLHDLYLAQGFIHAQDRGWQLEQQRRIGAGRLAEAFGKNALETDRFLRALGVRRAAEAQWRWLKSQPERAEIVELLQAYADGVNAGWRAQARPPEMLVLGLVFEDWTPVDTLSWALMMSWDLATNWNQELLRLRLALQLPGDNKLARIQELLPPYPGDAAPAMQDFPARYAELGLSAELKTALDASLQRLQAAAPPSGVEGVGSNNWAVSGARSVTGQPLLANDPHLGLKAPALWYLVRLEAPGLKLAGGSLPGMPLLVLGQNERLAWAFTNTGPDTQDLFLEELRDAADGGTEIRTPQGWEKAREVEELIHIKGGGEERLRVRIGRHGPLISDAGPGAELIKTTSGRRFGLALQWTALDTEQDPLGIGLAIGRARSWAEYRDAVRSFDSPQQTMLVAEQGGGIHMIAPGRVPIRHADNGYRGLAPAPGWEAVNDWQGFVPFDALPQTNGATWLASANHKIVGADYPHALTYEWGLPYRQQRIEALLAAREKHSVASLAQMQADVQSLAADPLLPLFKTARSQHALAAPARALAQGFDGRMDADADAPALFWAWVRQLTVGVMADEIGEPLFDRVLVTRSLRDALHGMVAGPHSAWCDDVRTPLVETCAAQADAAMDRALDELQQRLGTDPARWRFGELHRAKAEHTPFSRVALLRPLFELSVPVGGDAYTVNAARVRLRPDWSGERYVNDHGPSLRAVYDLADPRQSRIMISTGQSGLPWHPQYRDLLAPWSRVEFLPLWADTPPAKSLELRP